MGLELFGRMCESAVFAKRILVKKGIVVVAAVAAMFSLPGVIQSSIAQNGLDDEMQNELKQLILLAEASLMSKKWQEAKEQFVLASSKDPSNKTVLHELAIVYEHEGMIGQAMLCERKALRLDENFVPAQLELAHIYSLIGDRTNPEGHLKIVHQINPDNTGEVPKSTY